MPLGIGLIAAYCQKELRDKVEISLFKFVDRLVDQLKQNAEPFIVGFSNFMWNQNLNLEVSKRLKERFPNVCIVFGGFHLANDGDERAEFFRNHPWIDFYIPSEGERAFTELTRLLIDHGGDIEKVKKATPVDTLFLENGNLVSGKIMPRMDISENPSPYLEGFFDEYFNKLNPLVQTVRGCPFACAYCSEGGKYWSRIFRRSEENVAEELDYIARHCDHTQILFIGDTNFAMYEQDLQTCETIAKLQDRYSWPWQLNVTTGKNRKDRVLKAARLTRGAFGVSASVQSTDPGVLKNVKRHNVSLETLFSLAKETQQKGNSHSELILALPGDSRKTHFKTLKDVVNSNLSRVIPFQFMLLPAMALASKKVRAHYGMQTKFRVVARCFGKYPWLPGEGDLTAVEVEEICVGSNALSFADYLECRRLHLTIAIFYNDNLLDGFTSILTALDSSVFDFLLTLQEKVLQTDIAEIYKDFIQETLDELFDSPEELISFFHQDGIAEKYQQGEYGSNLLAKYRSLAIIQHMQPILDIAADHLKDIISQENSATMPWLLEFVDELKQFKSYRLVDFLDTNSVYDGNFHFDIINFLNKNISLEQVPASTSKHIRFTHTGSQKEIIEKNKAFFGSDLKGLSKMFANTNLNKLFRTIEEKNG